GTWKPPKDGDQVIPPDGRPRTWKKLEAGKDGWFADSALQGGYAYASLESPAEKLVLLEAAGHNMVYVNGEPRGGDPYGFGYVHLAIKLKAGANHFLFSVGRGR